MGRQYSLDVSGILGTGNVKILKGTTGLRNVEKVSRKMNLQSQEQILAYIKNPIPFTGPLVVLTDQAVHTHTGDIVPYGALCSYVLMMQDDWKPVLAYNAEERLTLLRGTLLSKNTAGMELLRFLKTAQKDLLTRYSLAVEQRNAMVDRLLKTAEEQLQCGRLAEDVDAMLRTLINEEPYSRRAAEMVAQDLCRTCDPKLLADFLAELENPLTDLIMRNVEQYLLQYIRDLQNSGLMISQKSLQEARKNLEQQEKSEYQWLAYGYICVRLNEPETTDRAVEEVRNRLGSTEALKLTFFQGKYRNNAMCRAYRDMAQGMMPLEDQWTWQDSLGLDVVHYAILLKQEQLLAQLMKKRNGKPAGEMGPSVLYDYTVLASLVWPQQAEAVYRGTSREYLSQERALKALKRQLWLQKRKLDVVGMTQSGIYQVLRNQDRKQTLTMEEEQQMREKLEESRVLRAETESICEELESEVEEAQCELEYLVEQTLKEAAEIAEALKTAADPLEKLLYNIFMDPSQLVQILSEQTGPFKLCFSGNFHVMMPAAIPVDLPSVDEQETWTEYAQMGQAEQEPEPEETVERPYGESWFSPLAHENAAALKKEYRALAKTYHPDCCSNSRAKEIFQEILEERVGILEAMNQNI